MRTKTLTLLSIFALAVVTAAWAQEKRARPPSFGSDSFRGVFFEDISAAIAKPRPSVMELRGIKPQVPGNPSSSGDEGSDAGGGGTWSKLAAAESIEGEIKRLKLIYDTQVAQPGPFKSGGYQDARLSLSVMATMFAIVVQYDKDIRFKKDAEAARNLLARAYGDCNSGSIQVFNQCKARKQDLDDLMNGSSISSPKAAEETQWSNIADRSMMMQYLDILSNEELPDLTNSDEGMKNEPEKIRQYGEAVALVGQVLTQKGMDESDEDEYIALAQAMIDAARQLSEAVERKDADGARRAVGAINQACDACHEQYQ